MTVYVDVVFLMNLLADGAILLVVGFWNQQKTPSWRIALAAILGAFYGTGAFYLVESYLYSTLSILFLPFFLVLVAFGKRQMFKNVFVFYLSAIILAGSILALSGFGMQGRFSLWKFSSSGWLAGVVLLFGIGYLIWRYVEQRFLRTGGLYSLSIELLGQRMSLRAMLDTGNSLKDPLSNRPVILLELAAIKHMLPDELVRILKTPPHLSKEIGDFWVEYLRIIPFRALGVDSGLIWGVIPDMVVIEGEKISNVVIGFMNGSLNGNEYQALLPKGLQENIRGE